MYFKLFHNFIQISKGNNLKKKLPDNKSTFFQMNLKKLKFEYKITLIYLLIGLLWILLSDLILEKLTLYNKSFTYFQSVKGSFFVILTALLLFILVRRQSQKQMQSAQKLNISNQKYKAIYEKAPLAYQSLDSDGKINEVNPTWLEITGYNRQEITGKQFYDFLNTESREQFINFYPEFKKNKAVKNVMFQFRKKNDELITILFEGNAVFDDDGNFIQFYSAFTDFTEEYNTTKNLILSEKRYKALFNENKSIILLTDTETGNVFDANAAALKFYGYTIEQIKNLNASDINILSENEIKDEKKAAEKEGRNYYHFRHRLAGGKIKDVQVYSGNLATQNKQLKYSVIHDITQQVEAENNLIAAKLKAEESDRLKTAFLANMSHEIRTPMNGIMGFTKLLEKKELTAAQHQLYLDLVTKSSERLLNTINDIIEISKIEAGQTSLRLTELDLHEFMTYLFSFYKQEAESKGLQFKRTETGYPNNLFITTDKIKLESILSNLIKNAIKFTEKGFVEMGCKRNGNNYEFYVKDSGVGIPKEKQGQIFNRFVQADNSLTKPYEGSGLGLSIAKAYAKMLHSKIKVESEVDKGSTFRFELKTKSSEKTQQQLLF